MRLLSFWKKVGGRLIDGHGMHDYQIVILTNALLGNQFTWCNNRRGASRI